MKKISFVILAVITIPINLLLMFLGDAFIWAGIAVTAVVLLKVYAPKKIWIALIIITIISIIGAFPRPLIPSETKQINNYLFDKYNKDTFIIKKKYLSVEGSGKYCSGTWISFCLGFKMFHWNNLKVQLIDKNNIKFSVEAKRTGFNKFKDFRDTYDGMTERNTEITFMKDKLIPILSQYNISDVNYSTYGWIEVNIITESVDKNHEEKMWNEIAEKIQYKPYVDPYIIIGYYKDEAYWYNEIEVYYLRDKEWNTKD